MGFNLNTKLPNLNFDTPDYEDRTPTPEGIYNTKCMGFKTIDKDGQISIILKFQVLEGVYRGKTLSTFMRPYTYERDFIMFRTILQNMGFLPDEVKEIGNNFHELLHAIEGLYIKVKNKITVKDDRTYNSIQMVFPADSKYVNGTNLLTEYKERQKKINKVLDKAIHREWT